jgi:hypothetical protein
VKTQLSSEFSAVVRQGWHLGLRVTEAKGRRMDHSVDDRCRAAPMATREEGAYSPYVTRRSNAASGDGSAPRTIE